MDCFDEELAAVLGQDFETCLSAGNNSSSSSTLINIPSSNSINSLNTESPQMGCEPPHKLQKPNNYSNFSTINNQNLPTNPDRASSTPIILNFGNAAENPQQVNPRPLNPDEEAAVSEVLRSQGSLPDPEEQPKRPQPTTKKPSRVRPPSQTYDHIIAERKRREQLSQRFVALSTIVPGLKKMDKTSVLGDAIKYLKHLQERVKVLEEQATKQTMESVVLVKKSQIMVEDEGSSDEKSGSSDEQPLPEIEARVCNSHILLRVHCEKHKGVLVNLLSKVEKLNLTVISTNVTPFGSLALDITIVAEMEKEYNLTVKDVVKRLRAALLRTE
ncbi:UNVERIFIED_CONTAM: Transcription factor [Sesamum calycinum]|uniref:Transcription factor n=2 Tax=Sesamum TaxID=4181 RepID=A0AAW2SUD8_9LAMI